MVPISPTGQVSGAGPVFIKDRMRVRIAPRLTLAKNRSIAIVGS